jgi:hypothetical protein
LRWASAGGTLLLLVLCAIYRVMPEPLFAKLALAGLTLVAIGIVIAPFGSRSKRDALFAFALALAHLMSSDWIAVFTVFQLGLIYALSGTALRARPATQAFIAAAVALLDIAFFHLSGYRFELTEIDVRVTFMLDRSAINLSTGFVLLLLQHSVTWLLLWTAIFYDRLVAQDRASVRTIFFAVLAIFVLRTWGPYLAMDFKLDNHWFVSHAIPMFILSMVECVIAWLGFAYVSLSFRRPMARPQSIAAPRTAESRVSP